jgi:hypothetical protein
MTSIIHLLWKSFNSKDYIYSNKLIPQHINSLFNEDLKNVFIFQLYENCVIEVIQSLEINILQCYSYINPSINVGYNIDFNLILNLYLIIEEITNDIRLYESIKEIISNLPCVLNVTINKNEFNTYKLNIILTLSINDLNELSITNNFNIEGFESLIEIYKELNQISVNEHYKYIIKAQKICNKYFNKILTSKQIINH